MCARDREGGGAGGAERQRERGRGAGGREYYSETFLKALYIEKVALVMAYPPDAYLHNILVCVCK